MIYSHTHTHNIMIFGLQNDNIILFFFFTENKTKIVKRLKNIDV